MMISAASFITGIHSHCESPVEIAVALRFAKIAKTLTQRKGDFVYGMNRCSPSQLGWRFIQMFGDHDADAIMAGKFDSQIEESWHESASAEHWYMYEKDWGN